MTTAFVFPGQGSQHPGMGRAFYDAWPEMRATFDRLDERVAPDLSALCFGDDDDRLRRTRNAQPAVFTIGTAVAAAVAERNGVRPSLVAGHSLGHYAAAAHAGLYTLTDGVELVARRGEAMERAIAADGPGKMVAVLLVSPDIVTEVCAGIDGVEVAAYNTDRQTVVSGYADAVAEACDAIEDRTRARFLDLDVGGGFHSPVVEGAVDPVAAAIRDVPMGRAEIPIASDVSGDVYDRPDRERAELVEHVRSPVDWRGVTRTLREREVTRVVEMPPAGTLAEFVSREAPDVTVERLEEPSDAARIFE